MGKKNTYIFKVVINYFLFTYNFVNKLCIIKNKHMFL